jgi:phage terminase small subunit
MLAKLPNKPARTASNRAPPPAHLEPPEADLWSALLTDFTFADPASLALLEEALSAHQRARRCREMIDRDGETVLDKWKQVKPHPLLPAERDARAAFLAAMRMLNLDIGDGK